MYALHAIISNNFDYKNTVMSESKKMVGKSKELNSTKGRTELKFGLELRNLPKQFAQPGGRNLTDQKHFPCGGGVELTEAKMYTGHLSHAFVCCCD